MSLFWALHWSPIWSLSVWDTIRAGLQPGSHQDLSHTYSEGGGVHNWQVGHGGSNLREFQLEVPFPTESQFAIQIHVAIDRTIATIIHQIKNIGYN